MATVALTSAKHSPGVTTSALVLATTWPRRVLLAECDPAGGDVSAGLLRAEVPTGDGLLGLALAARRSLQPAAILGHTVPLNDSGEVRLLAGLTDPYQWRSVEPVCGRLAVAFREMGRLDPPADVIVDVGRLDGGPGADELLAGADVVALVLRPTLVGVARAHPRLTVLRRRLAGLDHAPQVGLLLIGSRPFAPLDVGEALDAPVLGVLSDDPVAASVLSHGRPRDRAFERSSLVRGAVLTAAGLAELAQRWTAEAAEEKDAAVTALPPRRTGRGAS